MKYKLKKNRKRGCSTLLVEGDKGDVLEYTEAKRLQRGDLDVFLPMQYEEKKVNRFAYEVPGSCETVEQMLRSPISTMQLRAILASMLHLVRSCEENDLSRIHVLYEPSRVFYDLGRVGLRFVYMPVRQFTCEETETSLLAKICEEGEFSDRDRELVDVVLDYARRTTILTSVAFEDFLRDLGLFSQGVDPFDFEGTMETDTLDTRTSFGFDFVHAALQEEETRKQQRANQNRFLFVRLSTKMTYALEEGSYMIGRGSDCGIVLEGVRGVSRNHARIVVSGGACSIFDLGSTNGTFVNGRLITSDRSVSLVPGDRVAFAREEFELL